MPVIATVDPDGVITSNGLDRVARTLDHKHHVPQVTMPQFERLFRQLIPSRSDGR